MLDVYLTFMAVVAGPSTTKASGQEFRFLCKMTSLCFFLSKLIRIHRPLPEDFLTVIVSSKAVTVAGDSFLKKIYIYINL